MSDSSSDTGAEAEGRVEETRAAANSAAHSSPGQLLAAGRRARELTVDEVGDALNLAPQTVNWLEDDDYAQLPAPAFTQGYIRNYAKHVGLDADAVVNAYQSKAGKPDVAWDSPRTSVGVAELVHRHPGMLISVVVAGVVLLIVVILAVVWPEDSTEDGAAADPDAALTTLTTNGNAEDSADVTSTRRARPAVAGAQGNSTNDSQPGSSLVVPGSESSEVTGSAPRFDDPTARIDRDAIDPNDPLAHLPVARTYPVGESPGGSASESGPLSTDAVENSARESDAGTYPLTVSRRLTPQGSDAVRLEVVEDCWISIKNVAGEELYAILGRPGQTINLAGEGPFRVLLGYAPGASLYLNDRQILLEPYTRNSVASLVIGQ